MTEHAFNSAVGKTLRHLGELSHQMGDLFFLLASQLDVAIDRQADVNQSALWRAEEHIRERIDRVNEQIGDTNLMVSTLAEHEVQTDADLSKRVETLEEQLDTHEASEDREKEV